MLHYDLHPAANFWVMETKVGWKGNGKRETMYLSSQDPIEVMLSVSE